MVIELRGYNARIILTKELAIGALAFAALIAIFHSTAWDIVSTWSESNAFNHGFLILPICGYLGWRLRGRGAVTKVEPDYRGLSVVAIALALWLVGQATGTLLVEELSLVLIVQGVFLTMYGWRLWRAFMFPLLYLFFAVPVGLEVVPKLQMITAALAVDLLRAVGVPVFNDGTIITIPTGTFLVAEECSGVRFLIASIAIGTLFAGITYRSWPRRALFMVLSATVPIVANGFRAFGIILLTYLTNNEIAHGVDHITYGWIFFTLVMLIVLSIGTAFREQPERPTNAVIQKLLPATDGERKARPVLIAGSIAIILCAMAGLYGGTLNEYSARAMPQILLPLSDSAWQASDSVSDRLPPIFASPDMKVAKTYLRDDTAVHLHIGYYLNNRRGAQIVTSQHKIGEGANWILAAAGTQKLDVGGEDLSVQFVRSVGKSGGNLIFYWYWIDRRFTGNPYLAKLLEAKVKLLGGDPHAAIIAIGASYDDNVASAVNGLTNFAATLQWLPSTLAGDH